MERRHRCEFAKMTVGGNIAAAMLVLVGGAAIAAEQTRTNGWQAPLGNGVVSSYAEFDAAGAPRAMGIAFSPQALEGLPAASDHHHCTERHPDGSVGPATKCDYTVSMEQFVLRQASAPTSTKP